MAEELDEDVLDWEEWRPDKGSFISHMVLVIDKQIY